MKSKFKLSVLAALAIIGLFAVGGIDPKVASAMTCNSATLDGYVYTEGNPTRARFTYSTNRNTVSNGSGTPTSVQTYDSDGGIQQYISGLSESTTYYFRLEVTNEYGSDNGAILNFTTPACQSTVSPASLTVSITADQTNLSSGNSTTVRWSSNGTSCSMSGGSNGWSTQGYSGNPTNSTISGTNSTGPLTQTTTYNISCSNGIQSKGEAVTVYVTSQSVQTCDDNTANNYGGSGSCTYTRCTDSTANNYNAVGSCKYTRCMDSTANNYYLVGSCTYTRCTDTTANNYNAVGSCTYTQAPQTCTNQTATNYGGSLPCNFARCNDTTANNYNAVGSCTYTRCTDTNATNYNAVGSCTYNASNVTVTIDADDTSIEDGDRTTVRWNSDNAISCTTSGGSNGWSGTKPVDGTFNTGDLTSDKTYSITCRNSAGNVSSDSVTVRVSDNNNNDNESPDVTTKNATNITLSSATLNGRVDGNGSSVRAWFEYGPNTSLGYTTSSNSYGSGATDYSKGVSGLTPNTLYYFRAVAENSEDTVYGQKLTFRTDNNSYYVPPVLSQPTVVVYADSTNIAYNAATTIRWSSTNASSCIASGGSLGWAGAKSVGSGSFYTGSLTGSRTYTITCSNGVGSSTDSVTVNVRGRVVTTTVTNRTATPPPTSLVIVNSSIDRTQAIVPTIDNSRPQPGDQINYTVNYQNIGTGAITNLVLRLNLPYEVDYLFSTPSNPTISGNTLVFNLGTLRANGSGTVTVRVRVRENIPAGTPLNFPATLSYTDPSGFPQSVAANVSAEVWAQDVMVQQSQQQIDASNTVQLGANVFSTGFLPTTFFGWLILLILLLVLFALANYLYRQMASPRETHVTTIER